MKIKRKVSNDAKKLASSLGKKRFESETSESDIQVQQPKSLQSKLSTFKVRTISSVIMVMGFVLFLCAGHFYCSLLVLLINICIFKEIISLKRNSQREAKLPYFYIINWYFFGLTELAMTLTLISHKMILSPTLIVIYIQKVSQYKYLIMFGLFVFGIMLFVISLRKGQYKHQFSMFAWTIVTCALVVSQSTAVILNIYDGIIWFILPASMVIINDSFAYIFGVLFGKTPLIKLSPNKTVEGFIGGLISTIYISFFLCRFLSKFEYLLCQQEYISFTPFVFHTCNTSELLQVSPRSLFGLTLYLSTLEISSIVLAIFAGFIAPFGGFFASGVKRAFKIKDFGDSIPGHGGITDRMDCQILMGMFTCVWIHTNILSHDSSIQQILLQISLLSYSDQLELMQQLKANLY